MSYAEQINELLYNIEQHRLYFELDGTYSYKDAARTIVSCDKHSIEYIEDGVIVTMDDIVVCIIHVFCEYPIVYSLHPTNINPFEAAIMLYYEVYNMLR